MLVCKMTWSGDMYSKLGGDIHWLDQHFIMGE